MEHNSTFGAVIMTKASTLKPNHMWLFTRHSRHGAYKGAVHMSKSDVRALRDTLNEFLEE